ncbi:peptidase M16 inactive domain protein [bacterium BMS3Abin04]|nr:peptidase M16 inactive domain protein [bacterium BMS3Abin04]
MKVKIFSFLFIIFFSLQVFGQGREIKFTQFDLPNGLHVILHEDHTTPIVAIDVLYHVGSKNEDPQRTGFAHFFEHLMFEGSKYIKRGQFDKIMENAGATNNATTSQDRTLYYEILPSNQLELGLWIESERMLHAKIDSVGVETQRKVVKEERRQRYDNQPYGAFLEEVFKRAYKVHPYKWLPIGSVQYIDKASLKEFMNFYHHYYVPQNATLSISGDINIDKTEKLIKKYFADIPRGKYKIKQPTVVEPPQKAEIRDTVYYKNVRLPLISYAYHMPAQNTDDYYALQMLATVLSRGESSRLKKDLVDKQQIALNTGSFLMSLEDPGLFISYAIGNRGVSPAKLDSSVQVEINKVKNNLISEKEFQKVRNQEENDFVTQNSTQNGIASDLAEYYVFFHDPNLINTEINKYMKVTREDIKRVANKYLQDNNRVVLYYLPASMKK